MSRCCSWALPRPVVPLSMGENRPYLTAYEPFRDFSPYRCTRTASGRCRSGGGVVIRGGPVAILVAEDLLSEDVGMTRVPGDLLDHVQVEPPQGERPATVVGHQVVQPVRRGDL